MFDVITIGAAVQDVYLQSDQFHVEMSSQHEGQKDACFLLGSKIEIPAPVFMSGGGATNAAATFAHLGLRAGVVAKIGKDDPGRAVIRDLEQHGAFTSLLVQTEALATGYSVLLTTNSGRRTVLVHRGASAHLETRDIAWNQVKSAWIYMTSLAGNLDLAKDVIDFAAKHDIRVAWNPGYGELHYGPKRLSPLFKRVDVVSLNREEAHLMTGIPLSDTHGLLRALRKQVGRIAVLTDGPHGTYALDRSEVYFAHPNDVPVVNATGSGDAFGSAFVTSLHQEPTNLMRALQLGTLNAESVIQEVGAKAGILKRLPGARRLAGVRVEPYRI